MGAPNPPFAALILPRAMRGLGLLRSLRSQFFLLSVHGAPPSFNRNRCKRGMVRKVAWQGGARGYCRDSLLTPHLDAQIKGRGRPLTAF